MGRPFNGGSVDVGVFRRGRAGEGPIDQRAAPPGGNSTIMRNTIRSKPKEKSLGDIRAEYHFDYSKSKPNRFAKGAVGAVTIVLDPDVEIGRAHV